MHKGSSTLSQVGFIASILAFVLLLVLVLLPWPFEFAFPGVAVLDGSITLNPAQWEDYKTSLKLSYAVDEVFIFCWIVAWFSLVGIFYANQNSNRAIALTLIVLGLAGPALDFLENGYIWQALSLVEYHSTASSDTLATWGTIRHLSYIVPFSLAFLMLMLAYSIDKLGRWLVIISFLITCLAILGLYLPALEITTFIWWLLFFPLLAYLHWQEISNT